jgi:hypothetical protein
MGYSRTNDRVTVEMSAEDHRFLQVCLRFSAANMPRDLQPPPDFSAFAQFKRLNDRVTVEMSVNDYAFLALCLGVCSAGLPNADNSPPPNRRVFELMNKLSEGNRQYRPYAVPRSPDGTD